MRITKGIVLSVPMKQKEGDSMKTCEPTRREHNDIYKLAEHMVALANKTHKSVRATFKGIPLVAEPCDISNTIVRRYLTALDWYLRTARRIR